MNCILFLSSLHLHLFWVNFFFFGYKNEHQKAYLKGKTNVLPNFPNKNKQRPPEWSISKTAASEDSVKYLYLKSLLDFHYSGWNMSDHEG